MVKTKDIVADCIAEMARPAVPNEDWAALMLPKNKRKRADAVWVSDMKPLPKDCKIKINKKPGLRIKKPGSMSMKDGKLDIVNEKGELIDIDIEFTRKDMLEHAEYSLIGRKIRNWAYMLKFQDHVMDVRKEMLDEVKKEETLIPTRKQLELKRGKIRDHAIKQTGINKTYKLMKEWAQWLMFLNMNKSKKDKAA